MPNTNLLALFPAWATKEPDRKQTAINDMTFNTEGELKNKSNKLLSAMSVILPTTQVKYDNTAGKFVGTRVNKIA